MNNIYRNSAKDDAVMRVLAEQLLDECVTQFDKDNETEHCFSERYLGIIADIFSRNQRGRRYTPHFKHILAAAIIIVTILLVSCTVIKPLREHICGAVVEWYEDHIVVVFDSSDKDETSAAKLPTEIPDGYQIVLDNAQGKNRFIVYMDDENHLISVQILPEADANVLYDNSRYTISECTVCSVPAIYMYDEENKNSILTWTENGFVYTLTGDIEKYEILEIAEKMK